MQVIGVNTNIGLYILPSSFQMQVIGVSFLVGVMIVVLLCTAAPYLIRKVGAARVFAASLVCIVLSMATLSCSVIDPPHPNYHTNHMGTSDGGGQAHASAGAFFFVAGLVLLGMAAIGIPAYLEYVSSLVDKSVVAEVLASLAAVALAGYGSGNFAFANTLDSKPWETTRRVTPFLVGTALSFVSAVLFVSTIVLGKSCPCCRRIHSKGRAVFEDDVVM